MSEPRDPEAENERLATALATARETNRRLNARCQLYESAIGQDVEACRRAGMSLGRALANSAALRAEAEVARLMAERDAFLGLLIEEEHYYAAAWLGFDTETLGPAAFSNFAEAYAAVREAAGLRPEGGAS